MDILIYLTRFRNWIISVLVVYVQLASPKENGEFRTFSIQELFQGCLATAEISMFEEWIFAGKVIFYSRDFQPSCNNNLYTLTIIADFTESLEALRLMYHVRNEGLASQADDNGVNQSATPVFNLNVVDGSSVNKSINICDRCNQTSETGVTADDKLIVQFGNFNNKNASWSLTFTAYHTGLCHSYEYMCANKRCIFHSLSCNGLDPCGDLSDCEVSPAAYATIALGAFCSLGVIFLIMYMFIKSRKTSMWSSREPRKYKFSATKALEGLQSFTPATVSIEPLKRRWSYKY